MSRNFGLQIRKGESEVNTLKNVTPLQWLIILLSVNSAVAGATAQLTDLFGANAAHLVVSGVTFANTIIGALMVPFTGQGAMVRNVLAMDGVQHIDVNGSANATLAAIAIDPLVNKIAPTPGSVEKVTQTAKDAA